MTDETPPPAPEEPPMPAEAPFTVGEEPAPVPVTDGRRPRRAIAFAVVAALVAVAALGGVGYATLRHKGGGTDAKPGATPWAAPTPTATQAYGAKSGGSHYGSLGLLLLPMPAGYTPGPDMQQFGNDTVLDAGQAKALVEDRVRDLPKKDRDAFARDIKALHLEGAGLRTYTATDNELVVQMEIVQMGNKAAASAETKDFSLITKAMGVFRTGPKIKGHPYAVCVLPPTHHGETLDSMTCHATEGDLTVTMTVSGTAPLEKGTAADLLRRQLDRIKDPGEAV